MIKSFEHKGLEAFFYEGTTRGIQAQHAAKLLQRLERLDFAANIKDMDVPGYDLHQLKGALNLHWSVKVSSNWRMTFQFENGNAYGVNYQDYH
jgi:proteic killer suppression protein